MPSWPCAQMIICILHTNRTASAISQMRAMREAVGPCLICSTSEPVKPRYGPLIPPSSASPWDLLHSLVALLHPRTKLGLLLGLAVLLLGLLWCAVGFARRTGPEYSREDHGQDRSEGGQDLVQPKTGDLRGLSVASVRKDQGAGGAAWESWTYEEPQPPCAVTEDSARSDTEPGANEAVPSARTQMGTTS